MPETTESTLAAIRHCSDTLRLNGFETDALTLDQAVRELIASSESHRRSAGSMEENARELAKKVCTPSQIDGYTQLLTSWAATVRTAAMEEAAGIVEQATERVQAAWAIDLASERAAAIRGKTKEGGGGA